MKKYLVQKFGRKATSQSLKKGKAIYRDMLEKTEDVGVDNPMAGNIYMGYVLMAICRAGNFPVKDFMEVTAAFLSALANAIT